MSAAFYIVLDQEEVEFDAFVSGKAIANAADDIFDLCKSNNLKVMDDFVSQDLSEFLEETDFLDNSEVQWYEAQEGLDYFGSLIKLIDANDFGSDKQDFIADLNEFVGFLENVKSANLKWHLALDF